MGDNGAYFNHSSWRAVDNSVRLGAVEGSRHPEYRWNLPNVIVFNIQPPVTLTLACKLSNSDTILININQKLPLAPLGPFFCLERAPIVTTNLHNFKKTIPPSHHLKLWNVYLGGSWSLRGCSCFLEPINPNGEPLRGFYQFPNAQKGHVHQESHVRVFKEC